MAVVVVVKHFFPVLFTVLHLPLWVPSLVLSFVLVVAQTVHVFSTSNLPTSFPASLFIVSFVYHLLCCLFLLVGAIILFWLVVGSLCKEKRIGLPFGKRVVSLLFRQTRKVAVPIVWCNLFLSWFAIMYLRDSVVFSTYTRVAYTVTVLPIADSIVVVVVDTLYRRERCSSRNTGWTPTPPTPPASPSTHQSLTALTIVEEKREEEEEQEQKQHGHHRSVAATGRRLLCSGRSFFWMLSGAIYLAVVAVLMWASWSRNAYVLTCRDTNDAQAVAQPYTVGALWTWPGPAPTVGFRSCPSAVRDVCLLEVATQTVYTSFQFTVAAHHCTVQIQFSTT